MRSRILFSLALLATLAIGAFGQEQVDEKERLIRRNWSLFLEYYKMQEFEPALKAGWTVRELAPTRFTTLHDKMIEIYDTLIVRSTDETYRKGRADTLLLLCDDYIEKFPAEKKPGLLRKGYYLEKYHADKPDEAITSYETAIAGDYLGTDIYWLDRLARLYAARPETKMKAVGVLQKMLEKDPNNVTAQAFMKQLITDPEEFAGVLRDAHYADPTNRQKLYELANVYYETLENYDSAIVYFKKLVAMDATVRNYWERLAKSQQNKGDYRDAAKSYEELLKIEPGVKENWLNLGNVQLQIGDPVKARASAEKALAIDGNWGRPYMLIGQCYEQAAQRCVESKRGGWEKMKVIDKAVYALAQDMYRQAARDQEIADQARTRASQLSTLTPTAEDLFVNKIPKGKPYRIAGDCYGWINRSVTL
jgi:tetratricopeptide (TPR) repeat protein